MFMRSQWIGLVSLATVLTWQGMAHGQKKEDVQKKENAPTPMPAVVMHDQFERTHDLAKLQGDVVDTLGRFRGTLSGNLDADQFGGLVETIDRIRAEAR